MIRASQTNEPSEYIQKRAALMAVERLGPTEFRVIPREHEKLVRIVRFHPDYGDGAPRDRYLQVGAYGPEEQPRMRGVFIECFAEDTKEPCDANVHRRFCSHVHAAIKLLLESELDSEVQSQP